MRQEGQDERALSPKGTPGRDSFDELARGIATGTVSRGKALRLLGAALLGATLASIPGLARAVPRGPNCASGVQCLTSETCCVGRTSFDCCGGVRPPVCCLVKGGKTAACVATPEACKNLHGRVVT